MSGLSQRNQQQLDRATARHDWRQQRQLEQAALLPEPAFVEAMIQGQPVVHGQPRQSLTTGALLPGQPVVQLGNQVTAMPRVQMRKPVETPQETKLAVAVLYRWQNKLWVGGVDKQPVELKWELPAQWRDNSWHLRDYSIVLSGPGQWRAQYGMHRYNTNSQYSQEDGFFTDTWIFRVGEFAPKSARITSFPGNVRMSDASELLGANSVYHSLTTPYLQTHGHGHLTVMTTLNLAVAYQSPPDGEHLTYQNYTYHDLGGSTLNNIPPGLGSFESLQSVQTGQNNLSASSEILPGVNLQSSETGVSYQNAASIVADWHVLRFGKINGGSTRAIGMRHQHNQSGQNTHSYRLFRVQGAQLTLGPELPSASDFFPGIQNSNWLQFSKGVNVLNQGFTVVPGVPIERATFFGRTETGLKGAIAPAVKPITTIVGKAGVRCEVTVYHLPDSLTNPTAKLLPCWGIPAGAEILDAAAYR